MNLNHLSTYGEKEFENVATIIQKPGYHYDEKSNSLSGSLNGIDFCLPLDLLGINSSLLKLPSLPTLPDVDIPDIEGIVASVKSDIEELQDIVADLGEPQIYIEVQF